MDSFGTFFTIYWPPKTLLHRSESKLLKMHALLNWAIALSDVRTLFLTIRSSLYTHFLSLRKSKITHRFWAFAQLIRAMCPALVLPAYLVCHTCVCEQLLGINRCNTTHALLLYGGPFMYPPKVQNTQLPLIQTTDDTVPSCESAGKVVTRHWPNEHVLLSITLIVAVCCRLLDP